MFKKTFLLFWLLPFITSAQLTDDFRDGDITQNPEWTGDTDKFIVNENFQLQLNDIEAGVAHLSTKNTMIDNTQWEFWIRMSFTPSDNNHPRIYLVSDSEDLKEELNGYFIQIGKTGTDNKRLYFFRQDGNDTYELMSGTQNIASGTNNYIRIKVTRDNGGKWAFWADRHGGDLYLQQGSTTDNTYTSTEWFGLYCKYSNTRSTNFYFDEIYIGSMIPDADAPEVVRLKVIDSNTLDVHFSKVVEVTSAEKIVNYHVDREIGTPLIASRNPEYPNIVRLMFVHNFIENSTYKITIADIKDLSGNIMKAYEGEFVNFVAKRFDVVFNELMVNTTPQVGLPPYEYIELYNTTGFEIDVEGWKLHDRASKREIPHAIMPPKGYLVLTTAAGYAEMAQYGNVVALPGFTSASVTHSGTELILYNADEYLISSVYYSDEWYQEAGKAEGGWSLEKTDPYNFCAGKDNWRASEDTRGGTPAEVNSIRNDNPDTESPNLIRAGFESNTAIKLFFSEPMDEYTLTGTEDYFVYHNEHNIGYPVSVNPVPPLFQQVILILPEELQSGIIYEIRASISLSDCAGNPLEKNIARVAIPEPANFFDVVVNEILFNPPDKASQRYIELYNRSEKIIDLKDYYIASKDTIEKHLTTIRYITDESHLFFPGDYVVLTSSPEDVKKHYMTPNPEGFIRLNSMPRMTNTGGIAVFADKSHQIIDMVIYTEDMQYPLLYKKKGVALERLNYNRHSDNKHNWHSASESSGFGTPGYKNSQFIHYPDAVEDRITVYPEIFSPDSDGHNDVLNIHFRFDEPGFTANVSVYDSRGRIIKTIARSKLLGTDDVIIWDGTTNDNQKANIGIYIIFIELFDTYGNIRKYKKSTVLAGRL